MTEQIRQDSRPSDEPTPPGITVTPSRPRSRLKQALLCPFCRDSVTRRGTVACARRGCGALYHRPCWEEVVKGYGGCAIYGCESKKAREVSAAGWALRLVRLLVATVLFPRRVVDALRNGEGEPVGVIYARALDVARSRFIFRAGVPLRRKILWCVAVSLWFLSMSASVWLKSGIHGGFWNMVADLNGDRYRLALLPIMLMAWLVLFLPSLAAFPLTLGYYLARSCASAIKSEFAALARADDPEGTVRGRLRRGGSSPEKP